jgi:hypothetical protein
MLPCMFVFPNRQLFRTPLILYPRVIVSATPIDTDFARMSVGYEVLRFLVNDSTAMPAWDNSAYSEVQLDHD